MNFNDKIRSNSINPTTKLQNVPCLKLSNPVLLPDKLPNIIPSELGAVVKLFPTQHERSIALLSSLPLIASTLRNIRVEHTQGMVTPDLYVSIIAPSGSGKSAADHMRAIVCLTADSISQNRNSKDQVLSNSLFLSANTSKRGLLNQLKSNGGRGLIFDTEIDSLMSASRQDWGDFTDIMRKACEHQTIDILRSEEHFRIKEPKLSICLTGTPSQFKQLFTSSEDGNFSRFAHFAHFARSPWKSSNPKVNKTNAIKEGCARLSEHLYNLYLGHQKRESDLIFKLTDEQWELIEAPFRHHHEMARNGFYKDEIIASIRRATLLTVRIACIFEVLEDSIQMKSNSVATIKDKYLIAGCLISQVCLASAYRLLELLPSNGYFHGKSQKQHNFYEELPDEFKRKEALVVGESNSIANRTADKYLKKFVEAGLLKRIDAGLYQKSR